MNVELPAPSRLILIPADAANAVCPAHSCEIRAPVLGVLLRRQGGVAVIGAHGNGDALRRWERAGEYARGRPSSRIACARCFWQSCSTCRPER